MLKSYFGSLSPQYLRTHRVLLSAGLLIFFTAMTGCHPPKAREASPNAKRYDFHGKVVAVNKEKHEITVSHDTIKDYMEAMTMEFPLKDAWAFDVLTPGDEVSATLVVEPDSFWLEGIAISKGPTSPSEQPKTGSTAGPKPGDVVPAFSLVDQEGKPLKLDRYKGKLVLLTFIYTRCPLPEYCTLMSNNFSLIDQKLIQDPNLFQKTHLLSVTIDPAFDTPAVLKSYGASHTGKYTDEKFAHWTFATGKPDEIRRLAEFFGLTYFEEKNQITHSLRTAVITPDGKIYKVYEGNHWSPDDVLADVRTVLGGAR